MEIQYSWQHCFYVFTVVMKCYSETFSYTPLLELHRLSMVTMIISSALLLKTSKAFTAYTGEPELQVTYSQYLN